MSYTYIKYLHPFNIRFKRLKTDMCLKINMLCFGLIRANTVIKNV